MNDDNVVIPLPFYHTVKVTPLQYILWTDNKSIGDIAVDLFRDI